MDLWNNTYIKVKDLIFKKKNDQLSLPIFSLLAGTTKFLALRTTTVSRSADGR